MDPILTLNRLFLLSALSFYNLVVYVVITFLQLYRILRVGRSESPAIAAGLLHELRRRLLDVMH